MVDSLLEKANSGFATLNISSKYKKQALGHLEQWLNDKRYEEYVPQIEHLIETRAWDYLLDSFYQVIPFGTGGRRGEVGIGPNRINPITIQSSAQGHSQYLIKQYGEEAKRRGVVLAYDVRQFAGAPQLADNLPNPVKNMTSRDLAFSAAEVYAGNGIKVFVFDDTRTTPELSFAIRHLGAAGGDVFSASHNPPNHNGKKVYDEFGGQLIPPYDESLVEEVTKNVAEIKLTPLESAKASGLVELIGTQVDEAYISAVSKTSLSDARDTVVAYTPLHGTGATSITKSMSRLGFAVLEDPKTSNPSGAFENVTFNIPNPEVVQSFETSLDFAKEKDADLLISSDPDADRIGVMVKHNNQWVFLSGNEIATILTKYAATHMKTPGVGIVIKTVVTTDAIKSICEQHGLRLIDGLLIGFKYIGDIMNSLESEGEIDNFLLGAEESHGYLTGNYARDKDAATGAIWLSELAADLKTRGETLVDYLDAIYLENGYYKNYLTEIRLLGASGNERIHKIQAALRREMPSKFGELEVIKSTDYQTHQPIVSETDRVAKDILVFHLKGDDTMSSIKVTIRPSGTEPKIKIYFEIGYLPVSSMDDLNTIKTSSDEAIKEIEKTILLEMYKTIGVDFPERGFLLFWQLPLDDKLKYFEIESDIADLRNEKNPDTKRQSLDKLLGFLGANPVQKVNDAFKERYGKTIEQYLEL